MSVGLGSAQIQDELYNDLKNHVGHEIDIVKNEGKETCHILCRNCCLIINTSSSLTQLVKESK